jgi:integrase
MPITQRKINGVLSWVVDFRINGKRVRHKSPVQTIEGAYAFELELQRKYLGSSEENDALPQYSQTLYRDFAERWITEYVAIANKAATLQEKRSALRSRLLPAFGHLPIGAITTGIVDEQVARWRRQGLGMKRINNLVTIFRKSLRCAEEWGLIERAPIIRHYKVMPPLPQFLRPEESARVLAELPSGFWRTFGLFMMTTGARFGETAALRWEDFDLDNALRPYVMIQRAVSLGIVDTTKTPNSRRTIPLIPELTVALRALRHTSKSEWVFPTKDGTFHRPDRCSYVLKNACRRAGLRPITWHKLRHTYATQLMAAGVPLMAIKSLLGHTSLTTTAIYTHVVPDLMWDYVSVLSPSSRIEKSGDQKASMASDRQRPPLELAPNRA